MNQMEIKNKWGILAVLLVIGFVFPSVVAGQENGEESKTYEPGEFDELFLEGAFNVQLIQGNDYVVEIETNEPHTFDYLNVTNTGGRLHLHVDRKPFDFSRITLNVTFKSLQYLRIYGGISLDTRGYVELNDINMLLEGGAKVNFKVKADRIALECKGGVICDLGGVADKLYVRLAGAGHIDAGELKTRQVDFKIEGVGTGRVFATETLDAQINGAGKIKYLGDPKVNQRIDGLGAVKPE